MEQAKYQEGQYVLIREGRNSGEQGQILSRWSADETWWYRLKVESEMCVQGIHAASSNFFAYTEEQVEQEGQTDMEEQTIALQTLDASRYTVEIATNGAVVIQDTANSQVLELTARAAYQLLDLLYSERTRLYRCANGEPPAPELPAWIKLD